MINVTYHNTDTEQKMNITMKSTSKGTADIKIDFDPVIKEGTVDPYSIMTNIMGLFTGDSKVE